MSAPALTTARLRPRALEPRDRALFHELYGDAETMLHIGRPASRAENAASFRATLQALHQPRRPQFLAIVRKRDGAAIGICSIRRVSMRERSAEIGIMVVRKARGYGYAFEAVRALTNAALQVLPIDTIWAQYRSANAAVARLFDILGFSAAEGWRPGGAKRGRCVRVLRRSAWRKSQSDQLGDYSMSKIIGFLESAGRDAAMRHATREQLLQMMEREEVTQPLQSAMLQTERSVLDSLLGVRETMYCENQKISPPKKAPAKGKPAKKAPAKKPAKKAPSKKR